MNPSTLAAPLAFIAGAVWWERWQGNRLGASPRVLSIVGDIAGICALWVCRLVFPEAEAAR